MMEEVMRGKGEGEDEKTCEQASLEDQPRGNFYKRGMQNWANLGVPENRYKPIMCSSKAYSFHESEKQIIDRLREWAHDYFRSTYIYDSETRMTDQEFTSLDGTQFYRDFDFLGKLVDVEWIDDQFCNLVLKDLSGKVFQLRVNSKRYKVPQRGQIVRLRSVKPQKQDQFIGTTKRPIVLELSNFTNIMHIPHYFKQALLLNERIIEDDVLKKLMLGSDLSSEEITC